MVTTAETKPALRVEGLRHRYGAATVLALDGWQVPEGSDCVVLGPSGSGKTTLLHILAGLTVPSEGRVEIEGQALAALPPAALDRFRARRIGFVPQRLHLIGAITVADNLTLARHLAGLPPDDEGATRLLERLNIAELAGRRPTALSQGQAQRAAVARALVNEPALLLADEPTAALDEENAESVIGLLQESALASEAALVVATHDRRVAGRFRYQLSLSAERGRDGGA